LAAHIVPPAPSHCQVSADIGSAFLDTSFATALSRQLAALAKDDD